MKYKTIQRIIISILIMMFIIIISSNSFAGGIKPSDITGADYSGDFDLDFVDDITNLVRTIGVFIAVGAMMIIGIKYVTGSIEEKATYKKSMMPYLVGCFVLFGAAVIVPEIKDLFKDVGSDTEAIGNSILGIIRAVGTMVAVGVLMILGIKYMVGSTDERATYKKSMLPYIVGAVLIFASVNLTAMIAGAAPAHIMTEGEQGEYDRGISSAEGYITSVNGSYSSVENHKKYVEDNYKNWANAKGDGEYYYKAYLEELDKWLNENKEQ